MIALTKSVYLYNLVFYNVTNNFYMNLAAIALTALRHKHQYGTIYLKPAFNSTANE